MERGRGEEKEEIVKKGKNRDKRCLIKHLHAAAE